MKPVVDILPSNPRSRLFGIPAPPRRFEPLAIGGALVCLIAHLVAIPGLNELAGQGGVLEGELPSWYHRTTDLLLLSFAVNLLALLRIWWCGHERQGVTLAFFAIVTSAWMLLLLGFIRSSGIEVVSQEGFDLTLTRPTFLTCAVVYGSLVYGGFALATRVRRAIPGPTLAATLALLLGATVVAAGWTAQMVRSVFVRETFAAYRAVLPESTTAHPYKSPFPDHWVSGVVLGFEVTGTVGFRGLGNYAWIGMWGSPFPEELDEEVEGGPTSLEDAREGLHLMESDLLWPTPSEHPLLQPWRDNSLFLGPASDHHFEDLAELLDVAREVFPERSTVGLLTCRRYDRSHGIRAMLTGVDVAALHCIPLETLPIQGAPTVRVSFRESKLVLELKDMPVGGDRGLTTRLAGLQPEGINFECHPRVHVSYVVRILDAIRSAGTIRIAIPPASDRSE